jgi:rhodanese-related sulfurtransferase
MLGQEQDGGPGATLRGALLVLVIGLAIGATANTIARAGKPPRGLPWVSEPAPPVVLEKLHPSATGVPDVPIAERPIELDLSSLKRFHDADAALIVDGRSAEDYAAGHIAGAMSLPYHDALANQKLLQDLDSGGRPIVIYCSGEQCEVSLELADLLMDLGKTRVLVFKPGFPAWESAGYPVERSTTPGTTP